MQKQDDFVNVPFSDANLKMCVRYGQKMKDGDVGMSNVKFEDVDNFENYADGKIGEAAFYLWMKYKLIPSGVDVDVVHDPFREDYSVLNSDDDFIIRLNGRRIQIEVRHKTRNHLPLPHYEHCSDTIKNDRIYVFTDRCRTVKRRLNEGLTIEHLKGVVYLVGWTNPIAFRNQARFVRAGTEMPNDHGKRNFTTRRDEYNIRLDQLNDMASLLSADDPMVYKVPCP